MKNFIKFFYFLALSLIIIFTGCGKNELKTSKISSISKNEAKPLKKTNKNTHVKELPHDIFCPKEDIKEDRKKHKKLLEKESYIPTIQEKWCARCCYRVNIPGAMSCPNCGNDLISKKFCRGCNASFNPCVGFRYCPYCRGGILLENL